MTTQHAPMSSQPHFTVAEDGETIGTLDQFADQFQVTQRALLRCAEHHDQAIVLSTGESAHIVLILDVESQTSLPRCARQPRQPRQPRQLRH